MKKTLYIQPKVKVVKIDVEEAILTFSNTCIEKKNDGQNLQSKGTSFDFADE